jgi:hypothetical protein
MSDLDWWGLVLLAWVTIAILALIFVHQSNRK